MAKNRLYSIGFMGGQTCYLNVPLEEAKQRFLSDPTHAEIFDMETLQVAVLDFDDEFEVYDLTDAEFIE